MRNFVRKLTAAVGLALSLFAVASLSLPSVSYAQRGPVPRLFQTQQVHYTRFTVAFNSCVYVSLVCSVKVGALPYNAYLLRARFQTTTTWNAGTSASLGLGTVTPAVNIAPSLAVTAAGNDTTFTLAAAGAGVGVTGNSLAQTGSNGGFDLFVTITIVGALPTAGQTTVVLEWVAPNDGSCVAVPLGATSAAC